MDAFSVQKHTADFLNAGSVVRLDHCYEDQPEAFGFNIADYGSGTTRCYGTVFVDDDSDGRRSGPAADPTHGRPTGLGMRTLTFKVTVVVVHITSEPDWIEASRQLKQDVMEGIRRMIISDPALGTTNLPQPLFASAGESKVGIRRVYQQPYTDDSDGMRKQWAELHFMISAYEVG